MIDMVAKVETDGKNTQAEQENANSDEKNTQAEQENANSEEKNAQAEQEKAKPEEKSWFTQAVDWGVGKFKKGYQILKKEANVNSEDPWYKQAGSWMLAGAKCVPILGAGVQKAEDLVRAGGEIYDGKYAEATGRILGGEDGAKAVAAVKDEKKGFWEKMYDSVKHGLSSAWNTTLGIMGFAGKSVKAGASLAAKPVTAAVDYVAKDSIVNADLQNNKEELEKTTGTLNQEEWNSFMKLADKDGNGHMDQKEFNDAHKIVLAAAQNPTNKGEMKEGDNVPFTPGSALAVLRASGEAIQLDANSIEANSATRLAMANGGSQMG